MVDQIRSSTIKAGEIRVGAVARTGTVTQLAKETATSSLVQPATLAQTLAVSAPVDMDRVTQIKQAIADGKFPLSPSTVADRLIAARYEWMNDDQA